MATLGKDGVARLWTVVLGDGTRSDTALLADLAAMVDGSLTQLSPAERTRRIQAIRAEAAKATPGPSSLASYVRTLFAADQRAASRN